MPRCPIPGCKRETTPRALVCTAHGVQIWAHIESVRDRSGFAELVDIESDRMQRQAEVNARAVAATRARGWIYFLALDDKIKAGWTSDLAQRLKGYPPHAEVLVRYAGTRADERDLHRTLRQSRVAGREWYAKTPQVMAYIDDIRQRQYEELAAAQAERDAEMVAKAPKPIHRSKPRPKRGGALVRAILSGEDT